jgi:hypothetical protein
MRIKKITICPKTIVIENVMKKAAKEMASEKVRETRKAHSKKSV